MLRGPAEPRSCVFLGRRFGSIRMLEKGARLVANLTALNEDQSRYLADAVRILDGIKSGLGAAVTRELETRAPWRPRRAGARFPPRWRPR